MDAKKKILLVDGDQNFGKTVSKALNPMKYSFFYANTGNEGIQLAFDHQPDLILYNLALDPIDGYDVFRSIKTISSKGTALVLFLIDKANNETKGPSSALNEKDVIVKPINSYDFIKSIEFCMKNGSTAQEEESPDFNRLLQLSPYGIVVFAEDRVLKSNSLLLDLTGRDHQSVPMKLEDIFERASFLKIRQWIKHYSKDNNSVFCDSIIVKDRIGGEYPMNLKLSVFKAAGETIQFIGFVSPSVSEKNVIVNYQLAHEVCNMLKRENLIISEPLEKKITQIIKLRSLDNNDQDKSFFTKREKEVLHLTMEGLPIKVIADKLLISSRTVEKYRSKLMEKSGAKNIVEVIVFSLKNNLIKI